MQPQTNLEIEFFLTFRQRIDPLLYYSLLKVALISKGYVFFFTYACSDCMKHFEKNANINKHNNSLQNYKHFKIQKVVVQVVMLLPQHSFADKLPMVFSSTDCLESNLVEYFTCQKMRFSVVAICKI